MSTEEVPERLPLVPTRIMRRLAHARASRPDVEILTNLKTGRTPGQSCACVSVIRQPGGSGKTLQVSTILQLLAAVLRSEAGTLR